MKHEAQRPAAGLVALLLAAQSGVLLEACPLGSFERSHPFLAFVSEGEPGENRMTMRLPVDTFVMSAASGDSGAEAARLLPLLLGGQGCFVYVGKLALWSSLGCGCGGTHMKALCARVCQCTLAVFISALHGGVREDLARYEPKFIHSGNLGCLRPYQTF